MRVTKIDHTTFELRISNLLYNTAILHKCFYWYSDKFSIDITYQSEDFLISITNFPNNLEFDIVLSSIKKDLIDFKTRDIIANETANIRALLVAKAFAHEDEFDEMPPGSLEDPVGFKATDFY